MTLSEKIRAAADQAQHNKAEAYATLEYILRERQWPAWLQEVAATIDGQNATKDRPINTQGDRA